MAKRGRPSRAQASAKALANVDLERVDPVLILREIAADSSAPASARVAAAKALMKGGDQRQQDGSAELDRVSQRALQLLKGGRR